MNILFLFTLSCLSAAYAAMDNDGAESCSCFSWKRSNKIVPQKTDYNAEQPNAFEESQTRIGNANVLLRMPTIRCSKKIRTMTGTLFKPIRLIDSLRVLIIDPDYDDNLQLQRICKTIGMSDIQSAKSIDEVIDRDDHFDIIFIDADKTPKNIKKINGRNDAIVISTSELVSSLQTPNFKALGIDDTFSKPFMSNHLMITLKRHIDLYTEASNDSVEFK